MAIIFFWVIVFFVVEILLGSLVGHLLSHIGEFYPEIKKEGE